jgi:hypothetical protein
MTCRGGQARDSAYDEAGLEKARAQVHAIRHHQHGYEQTSRSKQQNLFEGIGFVDRDECA